MQMLREAAATTLAKVSAERSLRESIAESTGRVNIFTSELYNVSPYNSDYNGGFFAISGDPTLFA